MGRLGDDVARVLTTLASSNDTDVRLATARQLKNAIIGNPTKKALYVDAGAVPHLVSIVLASTSAPDLAVQAAASLGSLACGFERGADAVLSSDALPALLSAMESPYTAVVEASARALKVIFASAPEGVRQRALPASAENFLAAMVSSRNAEISEAACAVLAGCATTRERQLTLHEKGATGRVVRLLFETEHPRVQECALECLARMVRDNQVVAEAVAWNAGFVPLMVNFIRDHRPFVRLRACTLLSSLMRDGLVERQKDVKPAEVSAIVIPALVRLFHEPLTRVDAPLALATLVADSEKLQKASADADALNKIIAILKESPERTPALFESALRCLAALTGCREKSREVVLEAKVLPVIVGALTGSSATLRSAAAGCLRSLSRSVRVLRNCLTDYGIVEPLLTLLKDEEEQVQVAALGSLCNLVVDVSTIKEDLLKQGGLVPIVQLTSSTNDVIRLHAVWAIKNLLYRAPSDLKSSVMQELTFERLNALLGDEVIGVQEQAMTLLRNLAYSDIGASHREDIERLITNMGRTQLVQCLEDALDSQRTEIVVQAAYVVSNICTGTAKHKNMIFESSLLKRLYDVLSSSDHNARIAAMWCIDNLAWEATPPDHVATRQRIEKLRREGFEDRLRELCNDSHIDVRQRAEATIQTLENLGTDRRVTLQDPIGDPMTV